MSGSGKPRKAGKKRKEGGKRGQKRGRSKAAQHVAATLNRLNQDPGLKLLHPQEEFIVPGGLTNALPDVHVGPFFTKFNPAADGFDKYNLKLASATEDAYEFKLQPEWNAGVAIDALGAWGGLGVEKVQHVDLSAADEQITADKLGEQAGAGRGSGQGSRARALQSRFEWMNSFTKISADSHRSINVFAGKQTTAEQDRFAKHVAAMEAARAALTPLQRAEASFEAVGAGVELVHPDPAKQHLKPEKVWSVVPDEALWPTRLVHVVFADDPWGEEEGGGKRARVEGEEGGGAKWTRRAQLAASLLRTPADAPRSAAHGLVGTLAVPAQDDVTVDLPALRQRQRVLRSAAEGAQASAGGGDPVPVLAGEEVHLTALRQYNMTVKPYAHPHAFAAAGAAGTPPPADGHADSHVVLVWDDAAGVVKLLPLAARIDVTDVQTEAAKADVMLGRRTQTGAEVAAAQEARAAVVTDDMDAFTHAQAKAALLAAKEELARTQAQRAGAAQ